MDRLAHKLANQRLRKQRVRAKVSGTSQRPRLSIFISHQHITAQIIDDTAHKTLVHVTTIGQKTLKGALQEKAKWVGGETAKQAKQAKIEQVVFDRGSRLYHGRVKALADAAREQGLEL